MTDAGIAKVTKSFSILQKKLEDVDAMKDDANYGSVPEKLLSKMLLKATETNAIKEELQLAVEQKSGMPAKLTNLAKDSAIALDQVVEPVQTLLLSLAATDID